MIISVIYLVLELLVIGVLMYICDNIPLIPDPIKGFIHVVWIAIAALVVIYFLATMAGFLATGSPSWPLAFPRR